MPLPALPRFRLPALAGGLAVLALACCVYLAWWSVQGWWQRPTVLAQRDGFAEIALLRRAQELAPEYGTRVLNLGYENAFYYYRGELVGDWFGRAAFQAASPRSWTSCG